MSEPQDSTLGPARVDQQEIPQFGELFDDEETCRICGCTDTHGCVMVFSDLAQRRRFVERYALASAIEITENDVLSSSINLITVDPTCFDDSTDVDELPAAVCWWFADEVCVACAAELDQAMGVFQTEQGPNDDPISLKGVVEIKAGYDCYHAACEEHPTLRDMRTWTPPAATVDDVLHELPALLEQWADEAEPAAVDRSEFEGGPFEPAPDGDGADDPPDYWTAIELGTADPCKGCGHGAHYKRQCSGPEKEGILDWGCDCEDAPEEGDERFTIGHMMKLLDQQERGTPRAKLLEVLGCNEATFDRIQRIRLQHTFYSLVGEHEAKMLYDLSFGCEDCAGEGLRQLRPNEQQPVGTPEGYARCWNCDGSAVKRDAPPFSYPLLELIDELKERLPIFHRKPLAVFCEANGLPLRGDDLDVREIIDTIIRGSFGLKAAAAELVWKDREKDAEKLKAFQLLALLELQRQPATVKCTHCDNGGYIDADETRRAREDGDFTPDAGWVSCKYCKRAGTAQAERTRDGGFVCNRCQKPIPLRRIETSLQNFSACGFIICPGCEVCYKSYETVLPGVDLNWWPDLSSVRGALRGKLPGVWGFDDLLAYFVNYPHIDRDRLLRLLTTLQERREAFIDTVDHGWKGVPKEMSR